MSANYDFTQESRVSKLSHDTDVNLVSLMEREEELPSSLLEGKIITASNKANCTEGVLTILLDPKLAINEVQLILSNPDDKPELSLMDLGIFKASVNFPVVPSTVVQLSDISSFLFMELVSNHKNVFTNEQILSICALRTSPDRECLISYLRQLHENLHFISEQKLDTLIRYLSQNDEDFSQSELRGTRTKLTPQEFNVLTSYYKPFVLYSESTDDGNIFVSPHVTGTQLVSLLHQSITFLHNYTNGLTTLAPPGYYGGSQKLSNMVRQNLDIFLDSFNGCALEFTSLRPITHGTSSLNITHSIYSLATSCTITPLANPTTTLEPSTDPSVALTIQYLNEQFAIIDAKLEATLEEERKERQRLLAMMSQLLAASHGRAATQALPSLPHKRPIMKSDVQRIQDRSIQKVIIKISSYVTYVTLLVVCYKLYYLICSCHCSLDKLLCPHQTNHPTCHYQHIPYSPKPLCTFPPTTYRSPCLAYFYKKAKDKPGW